MKNLPPPPPPPPPRFMVMTYPAQGHINPSLQFAKRLATTFGADVTFIIPLSAYRKMTKSSGSDPDPKPGSGLSFAPFSIDGYEDGYKHGGDMKHYTSEMRRCGSKVISDLVVSSRNDDRPYCCFVYTLLLPWAAAAAADLGIKPVMLWIQAATVFDLYYYYFNGFGEVIREIMGKRQSDSKTTFPGLSFEFKRQDFPSFMDAEDVYYFIINHFEEQFSMISSRDHKKSSILVNTFDELESEALRAVSDISGQKLIGIGPLIPSAFTDGIDPFDNSFGGDIFHKGENDKGSVLEWLNSKVKTTVVYVSFGSILDLSKQQMKEIAKGLLSFGQPFLWVIKSKVESYNVCDNELVEFREELVKLGMIVPWCSQLEVLSNESVGCFVTHCGWNSTLESMVCGVPMVAFPKWSDQRTNAKLIEEEWKIGVRVKPNEDEIVEGEEIKRCLETVMRKENNEMERNGKKWKDLAKEAVKEGGSSYKNLQSFVAEMNSIS
ncbi:hypothetical protein F8388_004218 [Cannabis sativa]|uniref:Glycosyltransferase n=1 Tax=Cannabis sativa TaxID=3483 RepID=A0A7J6E779_CANSA|nr:hypothetical protein F8388_004218 [Cannabis sativa]